MAKEHGDRHRLIHYAETSGLSDSTTGLGRVLLESCSRRLPFGWLFLFGSRNIWEPGQSIKARGGTAAQRDPSVTPIDIAQVRLEEATSALQSDAHLRPICAALDLLIRILAGAGERGQLRLQSPPKAFGPQEDPTAKRRALLEWVALAENVVFLLGQRNQAAARQALESLNAHCAFVPFGDASRDLRDLRKSSKGLRGDFSIEEAAVRLMIGWPVDVRAQQVFAAEAPGLFGDLFSKPTTPLPTKPWWAFWK